jgi:EpsD family peptidyl-prolyl cis-trans isomerase
LKRHSSRIGATASLAVAAAAAIGVLTGCGDKNEKKPATQVAAKVNGGEISVHQINFVLQQQRGIAPEQLDAASRQVLDRLIDQELAVQKATEAKLDRDPRVVSALEAARREVLARAWLERQSEAADKPTAQEIDAYFANKPALFAKRRIYTFDEFVIQAPPQAMQTLQATLANARTGQALAEALKAARLPFAQSTHTRPAENMPLEIIERVAALNEGQSLLVPQPGGARAILLTRAVAAPVTFEQARPAIEQFLLNDRKRNRAQQEMEAVRTAARIEFVGKFARGAADAPAVPAPAMAASASASQPTGLDANVMRQGIKGLK